METRPRPVHALLVVLSLLGGVAAAAAAPPAAAVPPDLIAHRGVPAAAKDWSFLPFADQGAWFGFALPLSDTLDGGFSGPFVHAAGRWASASMARLQIRDRSTDAAIVFTETKSVALPGLLRRSSTADGLRLDLELWFDDRRTALVRAHLQATGAREVSLAWTGSVFADQATWAIGERHVVARSIPTAERSAGSASGWRLRLDSDRPATATVDRDTYRLDLGSIELPAETSVELVLAMRRGNE
ncbi:MAG: hypothetical protein AAGE94_11170, partial [Acidobacteriota bacterium]